MDLEAFVGLVKLGDSFGWSLLSFILCFLHTLILVARDCYLLLSLFPVLEMDKYYLSRLVFLCSVLVGK